MNTIFRFRVWKYAFFPLFFKKTRHFWIILFVAVKDVFKASTSIPYMTKFRRTNLFIGRKFFAGFFIRIQQEKYDLTRVLYLFDMFCQSWQNITADKIFVGQNFSVGKNFGSKSDFRQFFSPKFCLIRHLFI